MAAGVCAASILGGAAFMGRCVHFLQPVEQLKVKGLQGDYVLNGPGVHVLNPLTHRSAEVLKVKTLGPRQYSRIKNQNTGEERIEDGPQLLFMGAYDEVVHQGDMMVVAKTEYVFVLDKL